MASSKLLLALVAWTFATVAVADDLVPLFLPGFPSSLKATSVVASVIAADSSVRTYAIACPSGDSACSLPTPFTVVQGVNTLTYTVTKADTTCSMRCSFSSSTGHCHAQVRAPHSYGTLNNDLGGPSFVVASVTAGQSLLATPLIAAPPGNVSLGDFPSASSSPLSLSTAAATAAGNATAIQGGAGVVSSSTTAMAASAGAGTSGTAGSGSTATGGGAAATGASASSSRPVGQSTSSAAGAAGADVAGLTGLGGLFAAVGLAAVAL